MQLSAPRLSAAQLEHAAAHITLLTGAAPPAGTYGAEVEGETAETPLSPARPSCGVKRLRELGSTLSTLL